jgi:hypothetical protein
MMRFDVSIDGGDVRRKLDELSRKLDGLHTYGLPLPGTGVPLEELFDPPFMLSYTRFATISRMLERGGFNATSNEEFARIPEEQLDLWVAAHTEFGSWLEMCARAVEEWAARQIGGAQ